METTYRFKETQTVATSGASAAITNPVGDQIRVVRLKATEDTHVAFGSAPTATTSDPLISAGETEYVNVSAGSKVAAIQSSAAGVLYVTECTK